MPTSHPLSMLRPAVAALLAAIAVASSAGCTSPLTSIALREFLREATVSLAPDPDADAKLAARRSKANSDEDPTDEGSLAGIGPSVSESGDEEEETPADEVPVDVLIERSLERLARTRKLDATARDVLVETLEKSETADWPAIIDSFTASLEGAPARGVSDGSAPMPEDDSLGDTNASAKNSRIPGRPVGGLTVAVTATLPDAVAGTNASPTASDERASAPPPLPEPAVVNRAVLEEPSPAEEAAAADSIPEPAVAQQTPDEVVASLVRQLADARRKASLRVRRACFASKVRGWGNVDAFEEPRFAPGQNVLVYLELDNLVGEETERGVSTRVATGLRLVDGSGRVVEEWKFPTVEDTAVEPRTDYFVRYLVRIPTDAAAGSHRLEATVADGISSKTVTTELPLEVVLPAR